jgi:hypothetical protein
MKWVYGEASLRKLARLLFWVRVIQLIVGVAMELYARRLVWIQIYPPPTAYYFWLVFPKLLILSGIICSLVGIINRVE